MFCATSGNAEEFLDLASAFQRDLPIVGDQSGRFVDRFNEISDDVKIRYHGPGELVPVSQSLEAVSQGLVDATFSLAGYWRGRIPSAPLFSSFPFGFGALDSISWMKEGNGLALYQEMYDREGYDVKVVPCGMTPAETSGWFRKRIKSPEDLEGLRMRIFGFGRDVFAKFGVETNLLFADDLSLAIDRGELDAAEFSVLAADVHLELHKVTDYVYFPGWHQPSTLFELLVNSEVWSGLDAPTRRAVEVACSANILDNLANAEARNLQAFKEIVARNSVQISTWSPEMLSAFEAAWLEVVEDQVNSDRFFRKVWEDIERFRQEKEEWNRVSNSRDALTGP